MAADLAEHAEHAERAEQADLRMPALGASAWAGALVGTLGAGPALLGAALLGGVALAVVGRRRVAGTAAALLLVLVGAAGIAVLRQEQVAANPVAALAGDRAAVTVVGTVTSDPRELSGAFGTQLVWRLEVRAVSGRGRVHTLATPVLVLADGDSARPPLGSTVRVRGRLAAAEGRDLAALLLARDDPELVRPPGPWWRGAAVVRASLRDAVAHRPDDQRALVPALVVGDDAQLDDGLEADFRTTGLTHLLAVSGTNLTLVVGFLLIVARWCRVRGRWLYVVAAVGIVGFVLLARTEPSVLRAAVMGTVALVAMGSNGRRRGLRALGTAVLVLVLVDPRLSVSAGFALSVLATAGILVLAPGWRDAMARWLPRWVAEAVSVPAAAQLACTPVVAAISGQVSLVAVAANLLVAPAVGPATVLGLAAGLLGLVWEAAGRLLGTLAAWFVAWIVFVAEHGADLPTATIGWGTGPIALVLLTALTAAIALAAPHLLRRPATGIACCMLLVATVLVRPPGVGWPPDRWVLVACDVGQGDALVVRAGPGSGVVVDAGPDDQAVAGCLDRLGVEEVPLLVLTHFHADHVDGIEGVFEGRRVQTVETTTMQDPPGGVDEVRAAAQHAGVVPQVASYGAAVRYGDASLQVLWPPPHSLTRGPGDGSTANDASVVLLAEVAGLRLLLSGDIEPDAQAALSRMVPDLDVDVLKMPHHGSRYQDEAWLVSLDAEVVLVSVGAGNDYGHPAASALAPLEAAGADVGRTDLDGDLAVVVEDGSPKLVARGH